MATARRPRASIRVTRKQMNPNSQYHLAFNLGYPNAYDRSQQRTGDAPDGARQVQVGRLLRHDGRADRGDLWRLRAKR